MAPATERRLIAAAFLVYCALVVCMIAMHGMWLDELQPWCVARDSSSLMDLYHNTRFEGHPPLWYVLLFVITRFSDNPVLMQVLHVVIGTCTAALVLWRAPFVWWWRVLIVFGYFFLYEYTVIARNYGLALLFLLLAADARQRIGLGWQWSLLLALAAFTHIWGIVFAGAWVVAEFSIERSTKMWSMAMTVASCCLFSFWWSIPDHPSPTGTVLGSTPLPNAVARIATITTQGLLPWPDMLSDRPWNHNLLHDRSHALSAVLGLALLVAMFWFAPHDRSVRIFLALALLGSIALPIVGGFYSTRHYGPVNVAWLLLWWWMPAAERRSGARPFTNTLLVCQAFGGLLCVAMSMRSAPLSEAYRLPGILLDEHVGKETVVVDAYTAGPAISGYLRAPVYYTTINEMGSFCDGGLPAYVLGDTALLNSLDLVPPGNFVWCTARPELRAQVADRMKAEVTLIGDLTDVQVPTERIMVFHVTRP
ncbi:MAG: hypothetical protein IPO17_03770 [Flavobacteriales bacterium]|nr:hypothetical protein [Flavobacteriales bacterium]